MLRFSNSPIDVVYTWVDGNDPAYIEKRKPYLTTAKDMNPERFREVYHLLKYSLRALEQFVPWVGNVFLLTQKPQTPEWLNTAHPRVQVVHHEDIFDPDYLPTFSSSVIESYLHKIPGLSEYFLYMNDDFLFGRLTPLEWFISNKGVINIFGTLFGENLPWRIYEAKNDGVGLGLVEHCPVLAKKSHWRRMYELWPERVHEKRLHRFRQPEDFMAYKLYKYYMLKYQRKTCRAVKIWELRKWHVFHKITNRLPAQRRAFAKIARRRPYFYCLNDDQGTRPDEQVVRLVQQFLEDYLPEKSSFEK